MDYVKLGRTGLEVSRLCLGCMTYGEPERGTHAWTLDEEESRPLLRQALDLGINFFDTANVYSDGSSEEIVGRALKDFARRDEVVIATKVHGRDDAGRRTAPACRARRSWPRSTPACAGSAPTTSTSTRSTAGTRRTPIEETLEALHDVVKAGKARYIGASSMYAWQFAKALYLADLHGWTRFVSMQNHYNLLYREEEREMLPLCGDQGVAVMPWSPLARGRLTRDWDEATARSETDEFGKRLYASSGDRQVVEQVATIAAARGVPRAQVALAWVLRQAGRHRADRRGAHAGAPRRRGGGAGARADRGRGRALEEPYVPQPVAGFR